MQFIKPDYFRMACTVLVAVCIFACTTSIGTNADHDGYFDSLVKHRRLQLLTDNHLEKVIDSAYHAIDHPGIADVWGFYQQKFTLHYFRTHDYALAGLYTDSMIQTVDKRTEKKYIELYAKSLFLKGDVFLATGHYSQAFSWYYKARLAIVITQDSCSLAEYTSRLAVACYRQGKYLDAINYYKQTYQNNIACGNQSFQVFADIQGGLDNIGISFYRAGMKDSAAIYYNKALDFIRDNQSKYPGHSDFMPMANAVIFGNLANVRIDEKKYDEAEQLLKEGILINDDPMRAPEDALYSRLKLARIYFAGDRNAELEKVLAEIVNAQRVFKNTEVEEGYYLLCSKIAARKADHKVAYDYLSKYNHLRDSMFVINGPSASLDIQQTLDDVERQYQMAVLEKDNKRKSDYLWLTVLITVLAIVIVMLVLRNYYRSRRSIEDLTDLHQELMHKNNTLQQTLTALEISHQNNSRFMRIVAHDLRGPIGSITSLADILRSNNISEEKRAEMLNVMYTAGNQSLALINDLLNDMQAFGKLSNITELNVADIVKYSVELYDHQLKEKKQTVSVETLPAFVAGDQEKLWRVFSNLISNAIKFSRIGGEIKIEMTVDEANVVIAIHDQGIGVPENFKSKIFEASYKGTTGTSGEASFGLGLSISQQIISLHNGKIWFDSVAGEGASFYVSLPLA